jgi:hypothetical protein
MTSEDYATLLGKVVANLHSLEFVLRAFLYAHADAPHQPFPADVTLDSVRAGDMLPENALTDYSPLGALIERYNRIVGGGSTLAVDGTIVALRDALAHGRVSAPDPTGEFRLLTFERPSAGRARVSYSEAIAEQWLKDQSQRVAEQAKKVASAPGSPVAPTHIRR